MEHDLLPSLTRSGPDASVQSVRRIARSSRNVGQPDHVLAYSITGHKSERRPRTREEWLAAAKHDGVKVDPIFIDKTKVAQASRQIGSANVNLPNALSLQPAYHGLEVILDKCGVRAD